jgi:hypothetical protein
VCTYSVPRSRTFFVVPEEGGYLKRSRRIVHIGMEHRTEKGRDGRFVRSSDPKFAYRPPPRGT